MPIDQLAKTTPVYNIARYQVPIDPSNIPPVEKRVYHSEHPESERPDGHTPESLLGRRAMLTLETRPPHDIFDVVRQIEEIAYDHSKTGDSKSDFKLLPSLLSFLDEDDQDGSRFGELRSKLSTHIRNELNGPDPMYTLRQTSKAIRSTRHNDKIELITEILESRRLPHIAKLAVFTSAQGLDLDNAPELQEKLSTFTRNIIKQVLNKPASAYSLDDLDIWLDLQRIPFTEPNNIPDEIRKELSVLIEQTLDQKEFIEDAQLEYAIKTIPHAHPDSIPNLIAKSLEIDPRGWSDLRVISAMNIPSAKPDDIPELITEALSNPSLSIVTKIIAIRASRYASPSDMTKLQKKISNWVETEVNYGFLSNLNPENLLKAIPYVHPSDAPGLLARIMQIPRSKVYAEQNARKPLGVTISPLHEQAGSDINWLEKTGSDTYVLPREYDASIRIIKTDCALSWAKAFRNWPTWYKAGFNYVPVEDMLWVGPTANKKLVAVTTSNLHGRSLEAFYSSGSPLIRFIKELEDMKNTIITTLEDLNIEHGHLHNGNFVVVPYTTLEGDVDETKCPRLYVIDFDQATSG
ncbi:hypothetical protein EOM60_02800 [Candidatus Saccharibacteria bacterium]|nr:hypothetical protein [Candidatus Saccharibacteria bacterium]